MLRVRLFAVTMIVVGAALAGCSGASMSDMFKTSPPPPEVLQFQSVPAGATVQTAQGQTCSTPCSLGVPVNAQAVSFSLSGYVPQTVQLAVHQGEGSIFNKPPPDLVPNPVVAQLQAVPPPPPRKIAKPRPRKPVARPRAAAPPSGSVSAPTQPSIAAPEPAAPAQDNVFPPPPPTSASPFPPPPPTR
ncbi:MAG TPA: hypothetical protein VHX43_16100 [Xanthobacteraceae bacterium]|jgi:hypothetical protein|nr:hypothetical protein [Xanthobacteraceae bacterium]